MTWMKHVTGAMRPGLMAVIVVIVRIGGAHTFDGAQY